MTATTPANAGFHMPAEGARHTRTWMAWPSRIDLWNGRHVEAKAAYAAVAQAISRFEPLIMAANPADVAEAGAQCGAGIEVVPMALDDSWMRDIGPTFLIDSKGRLAGADWRFNAWGDKWPNYAQDAAIAAQVLAKVGCRGFQAPFVLEGGSIHSDGKGTVLTSEQCLLNPNRNPNLTKAQIEANLKTWLGAKVVIWVGQGLENDGTDGHVDNLACFARPGVVLATSCTDTADTNYAPMQDNLARLRAARDAQGRTLEVLELPIPAKRVTSAGRLAMTYTNFYLANGAVIAPSFDDPMDKVAAGILAGAFPDRQIVQIPALAILEGGGGIHCITQQQPAV